MNKAMDVVLRTDKWLMPYIRICDETVFPVVFPSPFSLLNMARQKLQRFWRTGKEVGKDAD